jgi:hypothetical protein
MWKIMTLSAGLLVLAGPVPAHAAPAPYRQPPLPVQAGVLTGSTRLDAHITWAAGMAVTAVDSPHGPQAQLTPLLLAHDDRTAAGWTRVPTPEDNTKTRINAVSASSPADVWLVGDQLLDSAGRPGLGIINQHWNGTAWSTVLAPLPPDSGNGGFLGVATLSPTDAWAAGWVSAQGGPDVGLLEHWDGTGWTAIAAPGADAGSVLNAVSATGPGDVWAAGYTGDDQPWLLHYDGHAWRKVPAPPIAGKLWGEVDALAGTGPGDVWAVGRVVTTQSDPGHGLVLHWDGVRWQQVTTPATAGEVRGVAATRDGVLAAGTDTTGARAVSVRYGNGPHGAGTLGALLPGLDGVDPVAVGSDRDGFLILGAIAQPDSPLAKPLLLERC